MNDTDVKVKEQAPSYKLTEFIGLLTSFHWLPIKLRIIVKTFLLTYKLIRGEALSYLDSLITLYHPSRPLHAECWFVVPRITKSREGGLVLTIRMEEADSIST